MTLDLTTVSQKDAAADINRRMLGIIADIEQFMIHFRSRKNNDMGYGKKPALIVIDLANFWTHKGYVAYCEEANSVIDHVNVLLAEVRRRGFPVVFTTQAYNVPSGSLSDAGIMLNKLPAPDLKLGTAATDIDDRLQVGETEQLIVKKAASAFSQTNLQTYLHTQGVDTVLLAGVVTSGCVRATAADAIALGFRPIVVRECVDDVMPGATEWTLFDISTKIGDVRTLDQVKTYLQSLD